MSVRGEVLDKLSTLANSAFGLVAALAWNDAVKALFKHVFGTPDNLPVMFAYAFFVTVLAVIFSIWIGRAVAKAKELVK
ncbi:conserved hypothetical protein [Ferroglobus placidus DSM 10642]|uniref:Uncharacterized protein n=1 Tax=Ferroglobus placidus (strain DSM 10642 / AEDII12DO) TaxID=589924 RepID=D3S0D0_FERPA|nr:DUF5654 family protein [Ferroglobus placidus]ADC66193.1 conserved hypothetical protein [Ferroglobus placidus DSM 10642]